MKKLVISIFVFALTAPAFAAQPETGKWDKIPLIEVDRAVSISVAAATWQQRLATAQRMLEKIPAYQRPDAPIPATFVPVLSYQDEQLYLRRLLALQASVNSNPALKGFTFVAPVPADLARFSSSHYATLHAFLKNLRTCQVTQITAVYPFTLAVRVTGEKHSRLEVWIDAAAKKVYLMSDNFYTTADGKYGVHLK